MVWTTYGDYKTLIRQRIARITVLKNMKGIKRYRDHRTCRRMVRVFLLHTVPIQPAVAFPPYRIIFVTQILINGRDG
ncbi:hypothetical protein BD410DRAFT_796055 [Rickenella mellea]|uniref:Uncharacterized protein n=1 Tax=Rickenella mellea TaxID=50990 RepID=A0A4Y7PLB6_9AGAM|nr:hypothetical protein BD410DRAFT_796055 [Rickenella mellea]